MAYVQAEAAPGDRPKNDDIGLDKRLELFRLQVEIRDCEKRAFDLFLQNRIVVDGNDADVVYRTALAALSKAREGDGPSLVECLTYRHSGHSRADPAKYRPPGELDEWLKRDPIVIYRERLSEFGVKQETIDTIQAESKRKVEAATDACKASPPAPVELLTRDVYADGGWAWRN